MMQLNKWPTLPKDATGKWQRAKLRPTLLDGLDGILAFNPSATQQPESEPTAERERERERARARALSKQVSDRQRKRVSLGGLTSFLSQEERTRGVQCNTTAAVIVIYRVSLSHAVGSFSVSGRLRHERPPCSDRDMICFQAQQQKEHVLHTLYQPRIFFNSRSL